ncbi:tetraspanin family protein, partial [Salmonella sp. s55004]|uniref:tetraspanin family protein n=1 Tax=Salmonella sp. s55004 TaxID=3159675 RepID=UPI003980F523
MAQGVNKLVKFMLFFFNFIFFLCGLTILIGVSLTFANYDMYSHYIGKSGLFVLIVLLIVGVFIFFTGFLGCCGALRENYCMLLTYAIIIFCLLLVEIVAGIAGFVFKSNISDEITKNMEKELLNYPNATNATKEVFDTMQ